MALFGKNQTAMKLCKKHIFPKWILVMTIILGSMIAVVSGQAQPVIEHAIYYTDYWYQNPFDWPVGHHFVACAKVQGSNPIKVKARDQNGTTVALPHDWGNWYCKLVENELNPGILTITATDGNGATAKKQSNNLDRIRKIKATRNIHFSNETISPAVYWDPNTDADNYYVRIYQSSTQKEIFRSPHLKTTIYQIPGDIMAAGTSYVFRILAHDYDVCSQHATGNCLENRSSTWSRDFTPRGAE
jgi:hypothetical protein